MTDGVRLELWLLSKGIPWDEICEWPWHIKMQMLELQQAGIIGFGADVLQDYRLRAEIRALSRLVYMVVPKGDTAPDVDSQVPGMRSVAKEYPGHDILDIIKVK